MILNIQTLACLTNWTRDSGEKEYKRKQKEKRKDEKELILLVPLVPPVCPPPTPQVGYWSIH